MCAAHSPAARSPSPQGQREPPRPPGSSTRRADPHLPGGTAVRWRLGPARPPLRGARRRPAAPAEAALTLLSMSSFSFFCEMLFWILLLKDALPAGRTQRSPSSMRQQLWP